ncbi:MAG: DNA polymerase III, subunit gamma and tau [Candidatus Margulisbacteria bacterium GWF2_35_9]|nr:MAG: DNA polymerase III, subunit gamma and tau [Candidatus Margulisbacteria bacterium GWF2_35_9]
MSYLTLYRKYRPQTFSETVEQLAVIKTLQNAIVHDRKAHAYIFAGPRGTGKTSLARIFAKAVNCTNQKKDSAEPCNTCENCIAITNGNHMDVMEVDAASNTSVDNVRELIEKVSYLPAMAKYKLYIIDETHMLSNSAFNALLKTLEEPPAHVVFILATTDPHKIPVTIQSRCQRLDLTKISQEAIVAHLQNILSKEKIKISDEAVKMIAKYSGGHMRDALSICDQVLAFSDGTIELSHVLDIVGTANMDDIAQLLELITSGKIKEYFEKIESLFFKGLDPLRFVTDVIEFYRNILLMKLNLNSMVLLTDSVKSSLMKIDKKYNKEQISDILKKLSFSIQDIRYMENSMVYVETLLLDVLVPWTEEQKMAGSPIENSVKQATPSAIKVKEKIEPPKVTVEKEVEVVKENTAPPITKPEPEIEYGEAEDMGNMDFVTVKHHWPKVLGQLKVKSKMKLRALISEGMPIKFQDNTIIFGFKKGHEFHYNKMTEEENLTVMNTIIREVFHNKASIKFQLIDSNDMPIHLGNDSFEEKTLIDKKDIPDHVKKIMEAVEGEVI